MSVYGGPPRLRASFPAREKICSSDAVSDLWGGKSGYNRHVQQHTFLQYIHTFVWYSSAGSIVPRDDGGSS